MHKYRKQSMVVLIALALTVASVVPAGADDSYKTASRSGEKMAVDLALLRPAGILATVFGSAVFVVALPFSALGGNTKESYHELIKKPVDYTFKRPIGDF